MAESSKSNAVAALERLKIGGTDERAMAAAAVEEKEKEEERPRTVQQTSVHD